MGKIERHNVEALNFQGKFMVDDQANIVAFLFSGSMDTHVVSELLEKVKLVVTPKKFNYIVDLEHLSYISSTGLGFLLYLLKNKHQHVYLSQLPQAIRKSFGLLCIEKLFNKYQSLDELENCQGVSKEILAVLRTEKEGFKEPRLQKRWVKILKDFLVNEEIVNEIQKMSPYIHQAAHEDRLVLPSEEKYTCILYLFLDRVFNKVAEHNRVEIDDLTVELIAKELMINAVKHGYEYRSEGIVEAAYKTNQSMVELSIIDYGKGFKTSMFNEEVLPSAGLKMMRQIFDELSITEAPPKKVDCLVLGKGTMIKMVKNLVPVMQAQV